MGCGDEGVNLWLLNVYTGNFGFMTDILLPK